jgi:hypothetical protein
MCADAPRSDDEFVEQVGLALFVAAAVTLRDHDEAVSFVEAARAVVGDEVYRGAAGGH